MFIALLRHCPDVLIDTSLPCSHPLLQKSKMFPNKGLWSSLLEMLIGCSWATVLSKTLNKLFLKYNGQQFY